MFPKITSSNSKGRAGQAYFEYIVNEYLKCVYHPIHEENDFGIDGYIELVTNGNVTGRLIGVQIKHGNSYFNNSTPYGYKYIGENKHLNYYMNNRSPIFLIIIDDDGQRMNWVQFDISKTIRFNDNKWWLEIPKENEVMKNFKEAIFKEADTIIDYEEQIQLNWIINELIKDSDRTVLAIPKDEIIKRSYEIVKQYINRISINKEILINSRTSMDIFFPEYKSDSREIFQIPEIMEWLKGSIDEGIPWFYFLDYRQKSTCFNLLVHSYCRLTAVTLVGTQYLCNYNKIDLVRFLEKNFDNLNKFMEKNNLDDKISEEISTGIQNILMNNI